jgi:GT2 family glycosyltransferase
MKSVAVVVLNYNGWMDSVACMESVLASDVTPTWVFLVDNASTDDSLHHFDLWAKGLLVPPYSETSKIAQCPKPIELCHVRPGTDHIEPVHNGIVLVQNPENRGYAAGNNVGITLALAWGADAVWILNNDTVVEKNALGAIRDRLFSKKRPGLCGALVCYLDDKKVVQCQGGGKTNPWTGLSILYGNGMAVEEAKRNPPEAIEATMNFVYGASVMASRRFLSEVGLMDERFFLYCEEQDWGYRAQKKFDFAYANDAVVYHKEGGSTGFSKTKMNIRSLWRLTRSRILVTLKHKPFAVPVVLASILFAAARLFTRRGIFFYKKVAGK